MNPILDAAPDILRSKIRVFRSRNIPVPEAQHCCTVSFHTVRWFACSLLVLHSNVSFTNIYIRWQEDSFLLNFGIKSCRQRNKDTFMRHGRLIPEEGLLRTTGSDPPTGSPAPSHPQRTAFLSIRKAIFSRFSGPIARIKSQDPPVKPAVQKPTAIIHQKTATIRIPVL